MFYKKSNDIYHHGVKGQKWGIVKERDRARTEAAISRLKGKKRQKLIDQLGKEVELHKNVKRLEKGAAYAKRGVIEKAKVLQKLAEKGPSKQYYKLEQAALWQSMAVSASMPMIEAKNKEIQVVRKQIDRTIRRALGESWF